MDKNYTVEQEKTLLEKYTPKATQEIRDAQVKELAVEFGKKARSIIAKLSRMDIYIAKVRTTKTGEAVVQKKDLVSEIAKAVGLTATSLVSLSKATKADLQALSNQLVQPKELDPDEFDKAETVS